MALTKAQQIKGLKKALKNKRTPRAFIPSMKKRLAKLTGAAVLIAVLCGCAARPAVAQTPVIIAPQQQTLATAGTQCTGTAQNFLVNNRNQSLHIATAAGVSITSFQFVIQGIDTAGNVFNLSDIGQIGGSITGSGYFPTVRVQVTCLPATTGTFALSYSGGSSTALVNSGAFLSSLIDKLLFKGSAANVTQSIGPNATPFGSSSGKILFQYQTSSPSGNSLSVLCQGSSVTGSYVTFQFTLLANTSVQQFTVPTAECPQYTVSYGPAGAGNTFNAEYIFDPPGIAPSTSQLNGCLTASFGLGTTLPISVGAGTTQQVVAPFNGHTITVCGLMLSAGVAGTVQITEGTGGTCGTGTVTLSGAMTLAVGTPISLGAGTPIFTTQKQGDALCITTAGGATAAGLLAFNYNPY